MRIDTGQHLRLGQHMKLAPRMIQSMEILQMTAQALEARIEQELSSNPTLELQEESPDEQAIEEERAQEKRDDKENTRELVVAENSDKAQADDFERLANFSEENADSWESNTYESGESYHISRNDGEPDKKHDAMANTASRATSLTDQLLAQWRLIETTPELWRAGEYLIGFIDDDGYLRTDRAMLINQAPQDITPAQLDEALLLVQHSLEPVGLGARDLRECLLLQIDHQTRQQMEEARNQSSRNHRANHEDQSHEELSLERALISDYYRDIEANRLPKIAKGLGVEIDDIKKAIVNLRQFHPHPGRLLVTETPRHIKPDAIIDFDEEEDRYVAKLTNDRLPAVAINPRYTKMARDSSVDRKTREFIGNNLRSARWLIDAIQQRENTLLRVINVVLEAQREFFDVGPQALKPLPMTQVADQLGIHVATVSRAVNEKYIQSPRGIYPLRMFFSGGTATEAGEEMSWTAVQAKLEEVIKSEDKANPLSDDELVDKLKENGIEIARRTIAKYRKQLNIPTARARKEY